ncbi:unnamed protein product [Didymodactylos carnosus]|uniref:Apple domain-containing protein n=1 Tax=Didymodactylos carnosus TaxID=1234261 RepID=A0A8S2DY42_9BILA|nr:unnamed protein product [Didymodactylos carnosus]CAF3846687.1 unnamed protein product [Didymodactylos carnosus]
MIRSSHSTFANDYVYREAYDRHFILNITGVQSLEQCAYQCHNNDYCRTATYYSVDKICSLSEEYSYVGIKIEAIGIATIISFTLCPNGYSEPEYLCFGDERQPVRFADMLLSLTLVKTLSNTLSFRPAMTTTSLYIPLVNNDTLLIYDLASYSLADQVQLKPGVYIQGFDLDLRKNYLFNDAISHNLYYYTNSTVIAVGDANYATFHVCMSNQYIVGLRFISLPIIANVFNKTTFQFLYNVSSAINPLACIILSDQLYLAADAGILKVNDSSTVVFVNDPCRIQGPLDMDAAGRMYAGCEYSNTSRIIDYITSASLASISTSYSIAVGKSSKYKYRLVKYASLSSLDWYEY